MARVKRGFKARRRRNKVLKRAKGYFGSRSRLYKIACVAVMHALADAYVGRKVFSGSTGSQENEMLPIGQELRV